MQRPRRKCKKRRGKNDTRLRGRSRHLEVDCAKKHYTGMLHTIRKGWIEKNDNAQSESVRDYNERKEQQRNHHGPIRGEI
jgi:hypothetical protein